MDDDTRLSRHTGGEFPITQPCRVASCGDGRDSCRESAPPITILTPAIIRRVSRFRHAIRWRRLQPRNDITRQVETRGGPDDGVVFVQDQLDVARLRYRFE